MKSLKAKFRKTDVHEWSKNDERLLSAVEHGEIEKVTALLSKKGASATKLDGEGKCALHAAVTRGHTECLAVILSHGADISVMDASGCSALHLAARHNHQDCAKKLIQSKCLVDALDAAGRTALHHAAAHGNVLIVQLLCEHKCPVNLGDTEGLTPLLLSAQQAHAEVCAVLLDWGADIDACDRNGRTAAMLAAESSCGAAVDLLIQRGADLSAVDSLGHDVLHYARLSGNSDICTIITTSSSTFSLPPEPEPGPTPPRTLQHEQLPKFNGDRSSTPKKRKAPPPPISPIQSPVVSPPYMTPSETPRSCKSDSSRRFNYKEEELRSCALKEEIERLQEERGLLLENIEDLKQIVEQTEPKTESSSSALITALRTKVAALSLENQQLAQILKKRPAPQTEERLDDSRPNSLSSNTSFHSTRADFDEQELSACNAAADQQAEHQDEVLLLREALQSLREKLDESRVENRSLQARLEPGTDMKELRIEGQAEDVRRRNSASSELAEDQVVQKFQYLKSCLEQEVKELKAKLARYEEEKTRDASVIKELEVRLERRRATDDHPKNGVDQEKMLISKYEEAQEEIKMLQEALRGTVSVEAAAKDFEEMKAELSAVIDGLQRRLMELSKSYSETKTELGAARSKLHALETEEKPKNAVCLTEEEHERNSLTLALKMKEVQEALRDVELKYQASLRDAAQLRQEAENHTRSSVSMSDHTQVMASLGNAIKNLEADVEAQKEQLAQKDLQIDALRTRLGAENVKRDSHVSKVEHEATKAALEEQISHLTQLLQDALRKQDEMALEASAAWQEAKSGRSEKEAVQKLAATKEQENNVLSVRCREAQEGVTQLKKQVENHAISEREKNKKIDDLSKEVGKLKEALNSLSQLSYASSSPKRGQSQQLDSLQQQIKQLQFQLTETKKQHHEIVSVYRMHLLYAVQGQMDEDVQKALKQILVMCKLPAEDK